MSADIYCWEPSLKLDLADFESVDRLDALYNSAEAPSAILVAFIAALLEKHPDSDDSPWSVGPPGGQIHGRFVNVEVSWSQYDEVGPFVVETAKRFGLCCFDLATENLYAQDTH